MTSRQRWPCQTRLRSRARQSKDLRLDKSLRQVNRNFRRALLNKQEGDEIVVKRPDGSERRFELVKLVTVHDS